MYNNTPPSPESLEALEARKGEKRPLTQAELDEIARWEQTFGPDAPKKPDFEEAMSSGVPPFNPELQTVNEKLGAATPPNVENANGELQRDPTNSVAKETAAKNLGENDVDPTHVRQAAASAIGDESLIRDVADHTVNFRIARTAVENIDYQKEDGVEKALNLLAENEAMAAAALAAAQNGAQYRMYGSPKASESIKDAEDFITQSEEANKILRSAADRIQTGNPYVTAKIVNGCDLIDRTLQEAREIIGTTATVSEQNKVPQPSADAENNRIYEYNQEATAEPATAEAPKEQTNVLEFNPGGIAQSPESVPVGQINSATILEFNREKAAEQNEVPQTTQGEAAANETIEQRKTA